MKMKNNDCYIMQYNLYNRMTSPELYELENQSDPNHP